MKWLILLMSLAIGQQEVNDDNFYGAIYKGMHLVRFTSEWSDDNKQNFYKGKFYLHCVIAIVIVIADARGTLEPTIKAWEKQLGIPVPEAQEKSLK